MSAHKGFTLVELLVVISIIAILSVIGMVVFTGVQKSARDAKRRGDIEAISKAFEVKYNNTGSYGDLTPVNNNSLFASGSFPKDPKGVDYTIIKNNDTGGFRICASLQDNLPCPSPSDTCFCKTSTQANPPDVGSGSSGSVSVVTNGDTLSCPTSGLVGYWNMNENSWTGAAGQVIDSSGNGNNGTASGGANTVPGKFGSAGNFNGSSGYIELGNPSLFNSNFTELTVSAWFKSNIWNSDFGTDYAMDVLVSKWDRKAGDIDVGFRLERWYGGPNLGFIVSPGVGMNSNYADVPIGSVSTGVWHHAVGTFKGSSFIRFYLDNVKVEKTTGIYSQVTAATNQNLRIGVMSHGYGFFNGLIDDVRIYNRALSDQEIETLYKGCI